MVYEAGEEYSIQFRPGWFDFAVINEVQITVDTGILKNLHATPESKQLDNAQISWTAKNLDVNEKTTLYTITFARNSFPDFKDSSLKNKSGINSGVASLIVGFILIGCIVLIIKYEKATKQNGYHAGRYGGGYHGGAYVGHNPLHHGGFGGGGCACACACACAGGGRVGCSERGYQVLYWLIKKKC
jgi:hypothetical protein